MNFYKKPFSFFVLSSALSACSQALTFEELMSLNELELQRKFESRDSLEVSVNLTTYLIGSEKTEKTNLLKASKQGNGFKFLIPNGPSYLTTPNELVNGIVICKDGMASSGIEIYKAESGRTIHYKYYCGTAGCGYEISYDFTSPVEICKAITK